MNAQGESHRERGREREGNSYRNSTGFYERSANRSALVNLRNAASSKMQLRTHPLLPITLQSRRRCRRRLREQATGPRNIR